ncbi:alanine--tRNA ligase [Mesoplasma corruscae]|uniref:Alanine--tRNA ligase n=1 Tax=Mesoplasma corruscae TaxID=216874 RepID=A0A2S5RHB4_9MOLU|nr:alanine--tRNA ligase [Mesoplasma corruscae]PPE06729.1 alanyl-tRNA synthetase [Mesoplasma corruscae]
MKKLSTKEIRNMWLNFFKSKNHHFLQPVSLIPVEDPSLLWINSGVATLKPYFDGRKNPPAPRLTNSQKAIRTNDIENVGVTARHHTMFEMLGNFSIGDYFKKEAIEFAWELLTSEKWFAIDKNKLYITVFEEDPEAYDIWINIIKIKPDHIFKMNRETNFWDVGQGPCGPNTEIFFDRGEKWDKEKKGTKLLSEDIENDRYIEIWNIVFSQFNNDGTNQYSDLPRRNIDTGAGLERIASIFQDTPTNFETDIFWPTINKIQSLTKNNFSYSIENYTNPKKEQTKINTNFKVIADHVRATSFAIADGVFPGNKERGYIIRRLIRRALIKGLNLGIENTFLYTLVDCVIESMSDFYPYLIDKKELIIKTIKTEEEKFLLTLNKGYEVLNKIIFSKKIVSGEDALLLFESYGYPVEQTLEIAEEKKVKVDIDKFYKLMDLKKQQARESRKELKAWDNQNELFTKLNITSEFTGWEETIHNSARVLYIFDENGSVQKVNNKNVFVILDKTPFYAEKGGQVGDSGVLVKNGIEFKVTDTQQGPKNQNIHSVNVTGELSVGDVVDAIVDHEKRVLTMKNHSGTHIIHSALRAVLGHDVMQSGSYNDEFGLRMDFTYNESITQEDLKKVEDLVNTKIHESIKREVYFCSIQDATNKYKALAFFAEKYDEIVRVVKFGDFSSELCGGTHVKNTKDIEELLVTSIQSKGSGVYRIKCLTSFKTISKYIKEEFKIYLQKISEIKTKYNNLKNILESKELEEIFEYVNKLEISKLNYEILKSKLVTLNDKFKVFEKRVLDLQSEQKINLYKNYKPELVEGVNYVTIEAEGLNIPVIKVLIDEYKNKYDRLIIKVFSKTTDQNFVVVGVTQDIQDKYKAIDIFKSLEKQPKGGGNASLAQGKYI